MAAQGGEASPRKTPDASSMANVVAQRLQADAPRSLIAACLSLGLLHSVVMFLNLLVEKETATLGDR